MARVKQVALKSLDATLKAALESVGAANKIKLKPPIINGIVIKPDALKGIKPELVARQVAAEVAGAVKDMKVTPKVIKGDGFLTIGYILDELVGPGPIPGGPANPVG